MPLALLPDRAVVAVTGADASSFLQGLVTCNVETLPDGEARLGALLSPRARSCSTSWRAARPTASTSTSPARRRPTSSSA